MPRTNYKELGFTVATVSDMTTICAISQLIDVRLLQSELDLAHIRHLLPMLNANCMKALRTSEGYTENQSLVTLMRKMVCWYALSTATISLDAALTDRGAQTSDPADNTNAKMEAAENAFQRGKLYEVMVANVLSVDPNWLNAFYKPKSLNSLFIPF